MEKARKPRKKAATIADIARSVGVSKVTVSNVLRGRTSEVSPVTAAKVRKKAREVGYVKNLAAAALAGVKTHTLAVIAMGVYEPHRGNPDPEITPFYGELVFRLERFARDLGYALLLYTGWENDFISFLVQRRVDAAVLVGVADKHIPAPGRRGDAALIMFDAYASDPSLMSVRTDDVAGGRLAAGHLVTRGCRRLAFVGDFGEYEPHRTTHERYAGARQACRESGLTMARFQCWHAVRFGEEAAVGVAAAGVDGVVAAADVVAAGLVRGLQKLGRRIPEDVAVLGYDNLPVAALTEPPLSTIDIRLNEKVRAVLDLLQNGVPGEERIVAPSLVLRASA